MLVVPKRDYPLDYSLRKHANRLEGIKINNNIFGKHTSFIYDIFFKEDKTIFTPYFYLPGVTLFTTPSLWLSA